MRWVTLTTKKIILIHLAILEAKLLKPDILDVEQVTEVKKAVFGTEKKLSNYHSLFQSAAGFIIEMNRIKPFTRFNTETGLLCADVFLALNEYELMIDNPGEFLTWMKGKPAEEIAKQLSKWSKVQEASR